MDKKKVAAIVAAVSAFLIAALPLLNELIQKILELLKVV